MKKSIIGMKKSIMFMILVALLCAPFVYAEIIDPLSLTYGAGESRDLSTLPTQSAPAQGGNVTALNIDVLAITQTWQGYYGNITGKIVLQDASNKSFYNWSSAAPAGEIYASRNATADFTTVNCASSGERDAEDLYLNKTTTETDSVNKTFSGTSHDAFDAGSVQNINACFSTVAYTDTGATASLFQQILLADDAGSIVYTTIMEDDASSFNGGSADFELLVGENEKAGFEGVTNYYFFVELS